MKLVLLKELLTSRWAPVTGCVGQCQTVAKEVLLKLSWFILIFQKAVTSWAAIPCWTDFTTYEQKQFLEVLAALPGFADAEQLPGYQKPYPVLLSGVKVWECDRGLRRFPDTTDFKRAALSSFIISPCGTSYAVCSVCICAFHFKPIRQDFAWCVWASLTLFSMYKLILDIQDNRFVMRNHWSHSLALEIHSGFTAEGNNNKVVMLQSKQVWK